MKKSCWVGRTVKHTSVPRFARLGFGMDDWAGSDSLTWWRGKRWCVSGPGDVGWIFSRGRASCSSTFGSRRAHCCTNWDIEVQYVMLSRSRADLYVSLYLRP